MNSHSEGVGPNYGHLLELKRTYDPNTDVLCSQQPRFPYNNDRTRPPSTWMVVPVM